MTLDYKYRIVEEKADLKESIIEKSNVTVRFTFNELESHEKRVNKMLEELEANLTIKQAEATNVENNHPFVKDATEDDIFKARTLAFYAERKDMIKKHEEKIAEIKKAKEEYAKELADISAQIGRPINVEEVK